MESSSIANPYYPIFERNDVPEFTNADRMMIDAEARLWCVAKLLDDQQAGAWETRINEVRNRAIDLAREMRQYNDQFETED